MVRARHQPTPLSVLVVVGELTRRLDIAHALLQVGHHVDLATSAEQAIGIVEQRRPDVIVTDLALPGVTGELFALSLKHGFDGIGLVALAGRNTPSTQVRCRYARIDVLGRTAAATPQWLDRAVRTAATRRARRAGE